MPTITKYVEVEVDVDYDIDDILSELADYEKEQLCQQLLDEGYGNVEFIPTEQVNSAYIEILAIPIPHPVREFLYRLTSREFGLPN